MRKRLRVALITLVLLCAVRVCDCEKVTVTILHTNDVHGHLQPTDGEGGLAYLGHLVKQIRAERGAKSVLLVDAGDVFFAAPPISEMVEGNSTLEVFNMIGYNVSVIGNHEFDKGLDVLATKIRDSNFTWLGGNIVPEDTPQLWSAPRSLPGLRAFKRFLLEAGGRSVSVCVVGGCTEETQVLAVKKTIRGLHFNDLTEMVVRYGATLSRECDVWFPVLHMGTRKGAGGAKSLLQIAREVSAAGLDVPFIIGGHQNQVFETPFPVPDTNTVVLEAGFKGRYLGDAQVEFDTDTNKFRLKEYKLHHIVGIEYPADKITSSTLYKRIAAWDEKIQSFGSTVVGRTYVDLKGGSLESTFCDLLTDAALWYLRGYTGNADTVAFMNNAGSVRDQILVDKTQGYSNITLSKTYSALPFDNPLVIYRILHRGATLAKKMIQVSGITFEWWNDMNGNAGVRNIRIGGKPLSLNTVYKVGTCSYLAEGGDGFQAFTWGTNLVETNLDIQSALRHYIEKELGGVVRAQDIPMERSRRILPIQEAPLVPVDGAAHTPAVRRCLVLAAALTLLCVLLV